MKNLIFTFLLCLISLSSVSAQLQPQSLDIFLPIITEWVEYAVVGYGDNGLLLTYSGEPNYEDFVLDIQEIDLFGRSENEWTAEWTDHGTLDTYHLADVNNELFIIGPAGTFPVTNYASAAIGVPPEDLDHDIGIVAENFVDYVDANNVTKLPISEFYEDVIVPSVAQFASQANNAGST